MRRVDTTSLLQEHAQLFSAYESLALSSTKDVIDAYELTLAEYQESSSFRRELDEFKSYCDTAIEKNKELEKTVKQKDEEITALRCKLSDYEKENRHLKNCLENLKNVYATKLKKIKNTSGDKICTDSEDDIDFDMTGESGKSGESKINFNETVNDDNNEVRQSLTSEIVIDSLKRSASDLPSRPSRFQSRDLNTTIGSDCQTPLRPIREYIDSTSNISWTNGELISDKTHKFFSKGFHLGSCNICESLLFKTKNVLSCLDCNLLGHVNCLSNTAIPCIPRHSFPRMFNRIRLSLAECCPDSNPMIPYIVIRCIIAIERFYINQEGVYRIPGNPDNIQRLYVALKNPKTAVDLSKEFPETIVGCLKRFLRELREPLIPASSWKEFTNVAEENNLEGLNVAFCDLPRPNADTLAFICSHLQRVIEKSEINKMPIDNIAQVMGPIIVGNSRRHCDDIIKNQEMKKQTTTMKALLSLPTTYWEPFIKPVSKNKRISLSRPISTLNTINRSARYSLGG
uniref:Rac GTPase-activating protein 1 n=1 Tax=Parastrongyloides trichosuri TaxID=131310 RepID=A0A0N4ZWR2_PARTI